MCLWGRRASSAAWWWRPIQPANRRAGLASRVRASSTNSSSPSCRSRRSPPAMSSNCICIAAPLSLLLPMKMSNKTPIAGVVSRPLVRSAGKSFRNGGGTRLLELGHQLEPTCLRPTEFAPAIPPVTEQTADSPAPAPGYGPPATATSWKAGRFTGSDFALQPDGTLCCPAGKTLHPTEQRTEHDGSLRGLYAARIGDCRVCPLREQCQWHGRETTKPRRVSLLLHPLSVGSAPLRLAGLEPQRAQTRLSAPAAPPTGGHHAGAGPVASRPIVAHLLSCAAGPLPSLVCRAVGAQCPRRHC